ncbi:YqaE/Pmp3 family membrane protein CYBJADRAFT_117950, partial [Cyberlindnera jadinii NRRL Y-1542]
SVDPEDVFLYLIAFFFPPLPVAIRSGFWTKQVLLNVLLTMMFGLPGTLHSIYIIYVTS